MSNGNYDRELGEISANMKNVMDSIQRTNAMLEKHLERSDELHQTMWNKIDQKASKKDVGVLKKLAWLAQGGWAAVAAWVGFGGHK